MWAPTHPVGATLAYTLLVLAWSWPLATGITRDVPWDLGDPLLNCWILAWHFHQAGRLLRGDAGALSDWWHPNIFHPSPYALGHSELLVGQALQGAPLYLATGNILLTYNLLFLSSFVLSAAGAFLFVRALTRNGTAAFVAGLLYGFAIYRVNQGPHLQVLSGQWLPFVLWGLHAWWRRPRLRHAVLAGVALALQNLSNGYYLIYAALMLPPYVVAQVAVRGRCRDPRAWLGPAVTALVGSALTVPLLYPYLQLRARGQPPRPMAAVTRYSADAFGWLTANDQLWFWGSRLRALVRPEGDLFPGLVPVLLAVMACVLVGAGRWRRASSRVTAAAPMSRGSIARRVAAVGAAGLVAWHAAAIMMALFGGEQRLHVGPVTVSMTDGRRLLLWMVGSLAVLLATSRRARAVLRDEPARPVLTFVVLAACTVWLSLGPVVHIGGRPAPSWPSLYALVYHVVPGADALRVPPRVAMLTALALSVLGGLGVAELTRRRGGTLASALLAVLFVAEGWSAPIPVNLRIDPSPLRPLDEPPPARPAAHPLARALEALPRDAVLADLPFGNMPYEVWWQYLSIGHWRARVNGYSGDVPPGFRALQETLAALPARPDEAAGALRAHGVTHVVLHAAAWPSPDTPEALRAWLRREQAWRMAQVGQTEIWAWKRSP